MITMLEQKQIEEMSEDIARMLCEIYRPNCDEYQPHSCSKCYVNSTQIGDFVEMLYEAGYRFKRKADFEPKVFGWVMIPVDGGVSYRCGNIDCCRLIPFGTRPSEMAYCPYCGANMKGGE